MASWPRLLRVVMGVLLLSYGLPALAADPVPVKKRDAKAAEAKKPAAGKFLRVLRDADGRATRLETAVVRYQPASGQGELVVDLVGAVHVGDRAYYRRLNDLFEGYDVVLYELVAAEGTRIPKGGRKPNNMLAMVQQAMKMVLDLDLQTDRIDYTADNFVHADLSPEKMAAAIRERGDDGLTLILSITADLLRQQNVQPRKQAERPVPPEEEIDLANLLTDPSAAVKLKRLMANQMEMLEDGDGGLGPTLNTILVADRNKAALKVFQKELAKGRTKVAIFYGAAHMPDFEKRLKEDFGLKRSGEKWLTAWDIKPRQKGIEDLLDILKLLDP